MEMQDIKKIQIIVGPTQVAYDFDEDGVLKVWLGAYVKQAPATAQFTEVGIGATWWSMERFNQER